MLVKRFPAEQEYKRDPELYKDQVEQLLEWVRKQPYLPNITEEDVILFLSSCYYSVENAKKTIDIYYTFRTHVPEFFANRDPLEPASKIGLEVATYVALPGFTDEGYKVFYCRLMDTDLRKYDFTTEIKCLLYVQDIFFIEEGASKGVRFVFDLEGVTVSHLTRIGPLVMKKLLYYLQEAMPVRLRGIHFVHPVGFIDILLSLMKPFLSKSTAENVFVHSTIEDLHKLVPKRMLPSNARGDQAPLEQLHVANVQKVLDNRDWITSEEKLRVTESLRPGKAKNAGDLFGVEGSFKKLDID